MLASASPDKTIKLWDVKIGKCTRTLQKEGETYSSCLAFSPDSKKLASVGYTIDAKDKGNSWRRTLWDVATGKNTKSFAGHKGWVRGVAYSPGGELLATASWTGKRQICGTSSLEARRHTSRLKMRGL